MYNMYGKFFFNPSSWERPAVPNEKNSTEEFYKEILQKNDPDNKPFTCAECGETFAQKCNLASHERVHFPDRPTNPKSKYRSNKTYKCVECGAELNSSSSLKGHMRIHTGERPYKCDECGQAFSHSSNLKSHKRGHTGVKPYPCKECGRKFINTSNLQKHTRTHTGEHPYVCGVCNKGFATSSGLTVHMRKHTGDKPYLCHVCKKTFAAYGTLKSHLEAKHYKEPNQECEDCGSMYRTKKALLSCRKRHRDAGMYTCDNCQKTFKISKNLQKHVKKGCTGPRKSPEPKRARRGRRCKRRARVIIDNDEANDDDESLKQKNDLEHVKTEEEHHSEPVSDLDPSTQDYNENPLPTHQINPPQQRIIHLDQIPQLEQVQLAPDYNFSQLL